MKLTDVIRVDIPWFRRGSAAWVLLAVGILAWDLTAADDQTLSESFRRGADSPVARLVIVASWAALTAHLFGVLPHRTDPLHAVYVARRRMPKEAVSA